MFVTHEQEEALEVADRIVVMNEGRIEQVGTATEVCEQPAKAFVYQFLGDVTLFHGRAHADSGLPAGSGEGSFYVRPHEIELLRAPGTGDVGPDGGGEVPATVSRVLRLGGRTRVELERQDGQGVIEAELASGAEADAGSEWRVGERVWARARRTSRWSESPAARWGIAGGSREPRMHNGGVVPGGCPPSPGIEFALPCLEVRRRGC